MSPPSHETRAASAATHDSLYLALFRVTAIADLEGPERAVEWAQSMLDDERLRLAFVAGVADKLAPRHRRALPSSEARAAREPFDCPPVDPDIPVIRFGGPEPRRFVRA